MTSSTLPKFIGISLLTLFSIYNTHLFAQNVAIPVIDLDAVQRCESIFPAEVKDPSNVGGWFLEKGNLCLFGSLASQDFSQLNYELDLSDVEVVITMSPGGPVDAWLAWARALKRVKPVLIVDRICGSSCANYLVPIAKQVLAVEGSLVVWHGGPSSVPALLKMGLSDSIVRLETETEQLYFSAGVSPQILKYATKEYSGDLLGLLVADQDSGVTEVDGYAFAPETLKTCFGFQNVDFLWHPGGDAEVFLAGQKLSKSLFLLESPTEDCEPITFPPIMFQDHLGFGNGQSDDP